MNILRSQQKGVASIPTVLVLMVLIVSVGILISSVSISDNVSVSDSGSSNKALNFAQSGAKDALEKLARDKDYFGSYSIAAVPGGCADPFLGCANVSVSSGLPKTITAEGRSGEAKRKIQVDVNLDSNGLIVSYDWREL